MGKMQAVLGSVTADVAESYRIAEPRLHVRPKGRVRESDVAKMNSVPGSVRSSSGVTTTYPDGRPATITLLVGDDPLDILLVLLHELAHAIVPPRLDSIGRVLAHTREFYRVAGELYAIYGIPLPYACWREATGGHPSAAKTICGCYAAYSEVH